mmetsp:Transcript_29066/g.44664  ORF Transcript_29066/g.44664 Transcript_29066/m.44664 type:complete len:90 (-) Transcript_29066:248-517(-)
MLKVVAFQQAENGSMQTSELSSTLISSSASPFFTWVGHSRILLCLDLLYDIPPVDNLCCLKPIFLEFHGKNETEGLEDNDDRLKAALTL